MCASRFKDRQAVAIILLLFVLGSFTPVFQALTYVPRIGSYFQNIGQFIPRMGDKYFMINEVDTIGYYSYLRSAVLDHDLDFKNDFMLFGWPPQKNVWTIGPAILWAPAFLIAHGISLYLNLCGIPVPINGVSFIYDFLIILSAMLYGLIGILFIYYFLRCFFSSHTSSLSLFFIFYASPLIFYHFHEPTTSHILTVFACSGFLYFWQKTWLKKTCKDWIKLGVWGGLIILLRPQDVFFLIFPVLAELAVIFKSEKKIESSNRLGVLLLLLAVFLCFIPQMTVWKILYGSFITIPQGSGFMHWLSPQILPLLFSTNHGLITFTPIVLFALIGLFLYKKENRNQQILFWTFFFIFLCELYVNSAAADWNAGWAFGARRFLSCSIIFAWGLANFLERAGKRIFYWTTLLFSLLVIFNLLFYFQWIYALIPRGESLTFEQYFTDKIFAFRLWLKLLQHLFSAVLGR